MQLPDEQSELLRATMVKQNTAKGIKSMQAFRSKTLAVFTALALLFVVVVDASTAQAQTVEGQSSMAVSADECVATPGGRGVIVTGRTSATVVDQADAVTVLDGVITADVSAIERNGNIAVRGTWTLDPDGSSSQLAGRVLYRSGSAENTELMLIGKGRQALKGTSVELSITIPDLANLCRDGVLFTDGLAEVTHPLAQPADGAVLIASENTFDDTVNTLRAAIEGNPALGIPLEVNHSGAAATRGIVLAPTAEIFFGNPALGSPLMANSDRTTGIDLPQKMVIWQDLYGDVYLSYNAPAYLQSRHNITDVADPQLLIISGALANLAAAATGTTANPVFDAGTVRAGKGLETVESVVPFDVAVTSISDALTAAPPINLALTFDHQGNADGVGIDLLPTTLLIFGNPSLGSVLMQANQAVALDLPQKFLIHEDAAGAVSISYNDPGYIKNRHNMQGQGVAVAGVFTVLNGALANFADMGAGPR